MANYGNGGVFDLGQIYGRHQNILNSRYAMDPNSPRNQLLQEQLNQAQYQYGEPEPIGNTGAYGQRGPRGQITNTFQPAKPEKGPSLIEEYKAAIEQQLVPPDTSIQQWIEMKKQKGTEVNVNTGMPDFKVPPGYMRNPDFDQPTEAHPQGDKRLVVPIAGSSQEEKAGTYPAAQTLAAGFADRMIASNQLLENIVGSGFDPSSGFEAAMDAGGTIGNYGKSAAGQLYTNARENWVTANLRKESGAVIGVEEMEKEVRKYFPMPGDGPEVIEQKKYLRAVATQGMINQAQKAYKGEPFEMPDVPGAGEGGLTPEELKELEELEALEKAGKL
jgi:hypothetical protein